jgi:TrmH family RNA methyltransferase
MAAIESPANPLIRAIARGLADRTHLLLEGEKAIVDAVAAGASLEYVLHDASIRPGRLAALSGARPQLVSRKILERLADTDTPQHLLAVAKRRDVAVAEILGRSGPVVFLFGVQDPGNLGAIVRVAEAAGAAGVAAAPGSADFFHPRAVRGSAGSVLRIPVSSRVSFEPFAAEAKAAGRAVCGAVPEGGDNPFEKRLPQRSVLVIGAEGPGLPAGAYRLLDHKVTIPMRPPVASLNAAVAAALLLYASELTSPSPNTSA